MCLKSLTLGLYGQFNHQSLGSSIFWICWRYWRWCYFPNGNSTIWRIYREHFLISWGGENKIQVVCGTQSMFGFECQAEMLQMNDVSCQWKMQHVIPEGAVLLHTDQTPVLWSGTPFWCLHMTKTQNMEKYGWYLSTLLDIPLPSTALCLFLFSAGWHRRVGLVLSLIFWSFKELETPVSLHCEY